MNSLKKQTGSFLVFTLWVLMILSIFSLAISYQVRQRLRYIQTIEYRQILRQTANVALRKAIEVVMKNEQEQNFDGFTSAWSSSENSFKDQDLGQAIYSVIHHIPDYEQVLFGLEDETSKLDINGLKAMSTLSRLIETVTTLTKSESSDLSAAIFDWRDEDESLNAGGAESREYRAKSPPYSSKNKPFETLEELLLVHGMTSDIFILMKPYITIFGTDKMNLNTALPAIMKAYGLSNGSVDAVNQFRRGKDGVFGTKDDRSFDNLTTAVQQLEEVVALSSSDKQNLQDSIGSGLWSLRSARFRVNVKARMKYRKESLNESCIISRSGKIFRCESYFFNANPSEVKELEPHGNDPKN